MAESPPATIQLAPWKATIARMTPRASSRPQRHLWCNSTDHFLSDVVSLKRGIIKTAKNQAKAPTILLLGETGVGKSSLLELIANVLAGNDIDHYDFNILDHNNEQGGSNNQSQTNLARIYELTSSNGTMVSASVCVRDEYA